MTHMTHLTLLTHLTYNCGLISFMKKLFSTRTTENSFSAGMFFLRVAAGSLMLVDHGLDKLMHFSQKAGKFADPFHFGPTTSLALIVFAEFFCAAFIVLGLFTRLAAIPLIIGMGVALFYAHKGEFFGAGESAGLYLTIFFCILIMGPGKISLDRFIGK
jgi:putative oxidoreductase